MVTSLVRSRVNGANVWRSQLNSERGSVSKEDSLAHAEQENGKKLYELAFEKEG